MVLGRTGGLAMSVDVNALHDDLPPYYVMPAISMLMGDGTCIMLMWAMQSGL